MSIVHFIMRYTNVLFTLERISVVYTFDAALCWFIMYIRTS